MAKKKATAPLVVIEGGKKTADQISQEQTAERFALEAWVRVVAVRILSEMSALAAETLARTQVDDHDDEETDEDFLNDQRDIENELVEKGIAAGLEDYPDVAALQEALGAGAALRTRLEQETALDKTEIERVRGEIGDLLRSAEEAAEKAGRNDFSEFKFEDRFTSGMFARLVRKALKELFEADPVFSKHVRDEVPGRNPRSYGQNCRTSSYGTYARLDDFVKQGGLAALFSGGWKRIAKDRIDPWAWSYEFAPERKIPQANWRHCFHITERSGERSIGLEIPREYLVGNGSRAIKLLMKAGVHVINRRPETLALAQHLHWKPKREIVRMPRPTWHQIGRHWMFVTADETIIPPNMPTPTQTAYELEAKAKAHAGTHIAGTVEGWIAEVAEPLRGNSNVALALGTFFAAPLLRFANEPGGGFHLYGQSTIGKTMGSAVGQSIWGWPHETADVTFGASWGGSEAGFDALASARADLGLPVDEITLTDKRTASQSVYKWASGTKGPRATSTGGPRATARYPVLVFSTGEKSLAEFLDTEIQEGCRKRMLDVPAEVEVGAETAFETIMHAQLHAAGKRFFDAMKRHHGAIGRAWLRYLVNLGPDTFTVHLNEAGRVWLALPEVEKIVAGVHPQVQAGVNRFALLAAALRMVIAAGLLPWTVEGTDADIIACMSRWAKQRGNLDTAGELLRVVNRVRTTITTMLTDRHIQFRQDAKGRLVLATAADKVKQRTPKEFDGYVKPDRVLIWPETWRRLCEGHDPIKVAEHLQRQKVLMPGSRKGELARTETILGKSGRFYVLHREWLGSSA